MGWASPTAIPCLGGRTTCAIACVKHAMEQSLHEPNRSGLVSILLRGLTGSFLWLPNGADGGAAQCARFTSRRSCLEAARLGVRGCLEFFEFC